MTPQELKYSILGNAFTGKLCENITSEDFGNIKIAELSEPPFDVPETWVWSTLGLCCEMYTGNSIAETVKSTKYAGLETGYDYIATKDVTFNQEICYDNGVRIPYNEGFKVAHKDAVLMCIEGGSAGRKIGILDRDVCFGNKLCCFHAQGIDNKYLYYYLQSWLFKELFSGNMTGIIGGVSIKKLKEILIPVAPIAEQRRIVAKIEEVLPLISRYDQAWSRLEDFNKRFPVDMQKSILQMAIQGKLVPQLPEEGTGEELFQQIQTEKQQQIKCGALRKTKALPEITEDQLPGTFPDSWKICYIDDIAFVTKLAGFEYSSVIASNLSTSGIPLLKGKNVQNGKLVLEFESYIPEKISDELPRSQILKRCLLTPYVGTIGNIAVFDGSFKAHLGSNVGKIELLNGEEQYVLEEYVLYYLRSDIGYRELTKYKKATAQESISIDAIRNVIIAIPPLAEQKRIVAKLEEILPLCERLK